MELAPEGDDFHEFVRDGLAAWADPEDAGMHRTATHDYDVVLEGVVGLELDGGVEVTLRPGDVVVSTAATVGTTAATRSLMCSRSVGAYNEIEVDAPSEQRVINAGAPVRQICRA